jgi:hypothetical protein
MKIDALKPSCLASETVPARAAEERTAQAPARSLGPLSTLGSMLKGPTRSNFGLASLNISASTTGGPTRPDVKKTPRPPVPLQATQLSARRQAAVGRKVDAGFTSLHAVDHPSNAAPQMPQTQQAMTSAAGYRGAVEAMFGAGEAAQALANGVLDAMPAAPEGLTHKGPLMLATALHAICAGSPANATQLLDDAVNNRESAHLFSLQRVLAQTTSGTDALGHLLQIQDPAAKDSLRESLNMCADLEQKGFPAAEHSSVQGVVRALGNQEGVRLDHAVGTDQDAPLQLLAKALTYAHGQGDVAGAQLPQHKAAYVAWKKGGFTESGPGTDFNKTIDRMHKFLTYVDRADHGPRTAGNLASEIGSLFPKAIGHQKSPLSSTRHGTLGGDLGLLHEEAQKFKEALGDAISPVRHHLELEIMRPDVQRNPAHLHARLARASVLALWEAKGRTDITVQISDVVNRAREMQAELGGNLALFDVEAIRTQLSTFAKRPRLDRLHKGEPRVKLELKMLDDMAPTLAGRHAVRPDAAQDIEALRSESRALRKLPQRTDAQNQRLNEVQKRLLDQSGALIAKARNIKHGGEPGIPLFKATDARDMLLGKPARPGPTAADAQHVMQRLAEAKYESMSQFSEGGGGGLSVPGAMVLNVVSHIGVPLVFPVLSGERGSKANVTVGVSNTGGRFFVGKESSVSGDVGGGGVWGVGIPKTPLRAAVIGGLSAGGTLGQGEGACITTRNDMPGWEGKLKEVVDFMFEQAKPELRPPAPRGAPDLIDRGAAESDERIQPGGGGQTVSENAAAAGRQPAAQPRPPSGSELWGRFAERFGDDPVVAINWESERPASGRAQLSGAAAMRVADTPAVAIGPVASANVRFTASRFSRTPGAPGADVPVEVRSKLVTAGVGASVSQTTTPASIAHGPFSSWTMAVPLVGASLEWNIAGTLGVARLGRTREGLLSPSQCHREVIFRNPHRLVEYANSQRSVWEAALVSKDETGRTTPARAREKINEFLQQVKSAPTAGDHFYGELVTLKPEVADRINDYEARLSTLLGKGDAQASQRPLSESVRAECNLLQNEVHHLLKEESSWNPGGLYAAEITGRARNAGWDAIAKVSGQSQAQAARLTALVFPGQPEPGDAVDSESLADPQQPAHAPAPAGPSHDADEIQPADPHDADSSTGTSFFSARETFQSE